MDENIDIFDIVVEDPVNQEEESLPAVSEGVPEEIPEDITDSITEDITGNISEDLTGDLSNDTYVSYEDYLSSVQEMYSEVIIDYSSDLQLINENLSSLNSTCSLIAFTLLIGYFVPFIRSMVHKFMFIGDKEK